MMGAAEALKDDVTSGLNPMEPMFEGTLAYGFFGTLPGVILADALIKANRSEEALSLLKRLLDGGAGIFTPELWRMRGELLRRRSGTNADEVERFLARAMRVASEQGQSCTGSEPRPLWVGSCWSTAAPDGPEACWIICPSFAR